MEPRLSTPGAGVVMDRAAEEMQPYIAATRIGRDDSRGATRAERVG